ncbi:MAG TPA: 2-phospho-L-lactate guanylyltransferase [Nitrososphaera sp.]|jgi:2-phospho-L-lactate guanylyltransferase|nr:2-phospho-L-lactate guanylyltransferase [Nitrososphaera sp.]
MKTFAIVPIKKLENAKTRLSSLLDTDDRIHLSLLMLQDTLQTLSVVQSLTQIITVSADKRVEKIALKYGATFLLEEKERGVNSAIALADNYCIKEAADATMVIPHDLPLLNSIDISKACELAENESRCIVICPSLRYDGTNMLLRIPPSIITTFYDADSYNAHVKAATRLGISVKLLFSKGLMHDIDTPEDASAIIKEETPVTSSSLEFIKSKF